MLRISVLLTSLLISLGVALSVSAVTSTTSAPAKPTHIAILGYPGFTGSDAFGPIEFLWRAANQVGFQVTVIGDQPGVIQANARNTTALIASTRFGRPPSIDVLLVPGGLDEAAVDSNPEILNYIRKTYPKLKYILSVCTGSRILARAGLLDGRNATTNKRGWASIVTSGPKTNWIAKARWVVDGNVWTSSGVMAGMDMTHRWLGHAFQNETMADLIAGGMEHIVLRDASADPFADMWGAKDVPPVAF